MLDPMQCSYGYLATPLIESCQRLGVFERLDTQVFQDCATLARKLDVHAGPLTAALRSLGALGWLQQDGHGGYRLAHSQFRQPTRLNLAPLYAIEPSAFRAAGEPAAALAARIDEVFFQTRAERQPWDALAEGAVVVLVASAFKGVDPARFGDALKRLGAPLSATIRKLFVQQRWLTDARARLSTPGVALLQAQAIDDAVRYRPMLAAMNEILHGTVTRVGELLAPGKNAQEILDQSLAFTGVSRADCLDDLRREVVELFDEPLLERRPNVVACLADDPALAEVAQAIGLSTALSQSPGHGPLRVLTVVPEEAADDPSQAARRTTLRERLRELSVSDDENLLLVQIGSNAPGAQDWDGTVDAELAVLADEQPVYVDQFGQQLGPLVVLTAWQRHLQHWAELERVARLLLLQTHATSPSAGRGAMEQSERACVEALDALAGKRLITAEAFICISARVGLFNEGCVKRHPRVSRVCAASVHRLVKRNYRVRHATERDLARLCELERLCWQHTLSSEETIRVRLTNYPQGQFVLECDGRVLGVVYSQRIDAVDALAQHDASIVHQLHRVDGATVQLLAINVDPKVQNMRYGDQLLEFMLQRCSMVAGVRRVVGVTLCKSYAAGVGESFEHYIRREGASQDPVLAFHQFHGAQIVGVIAGYRPDDRVNETHGVLVSYNILHRAEQLQTQASVAAGAVVTDVPTEEQIEKFLREQTILLLGGDHARFGVDCPFMEMGLDSAGLLKLQQLLERQCGERLPVSFFFEFNCIRKVSAQLAHPLASNSAAPLVARTAVGTAMSSDAVALPRAADPVSADIAVVGMACRLPGGIDTPSQLWDVLASGACVVGDFPSGRGRWPSAGEWPGIDQGGFIKDVDAFDAAFFRISPAEAQLLDPQQRLALELAWACFEDANVLPADVAGTGIGVFVGASNSDYSRVLQDAGVEVEAHLGVASSLAVIANRLSYFFDLSGPSLLIDTACSSSLVALHTAVQSLRSKECATALVAGVNVICHPDLSVAYHKAGMLAADGRCKVFDARANGYVRAEGAVVLLLKPLSRALADGDQIRAVIKGSAINHGGLASGLTVPNPVKQRELLVTAWDNAGIRAEQLSYIEAHGTGTSLGDPIEVQAIQTAYAQRAASPALRACGLGSLKSNLGHLESAAGLAGVLKVILAMQRRQLPPTTNFDKLNPKIDLLDAFYIQDRLSDWQAPTRMAGVSSFGSGGANAHVVVQEYVSAATAHVSDGPDLFVLSAASRERLQEYAARVVRWLDETADDGRFGDAIYSWQTGRTAMSTRIALKVGDRAELKAKLTQWLADGKEPAQGWFGEVNPGTVANARLWQTKSAALLIDHATRERDFDQLGALWVTGIQIDWSKLHQGTRAGGNPPRLVSLPTYPFARERYWIDAPVSTPSTAMTAVLHPLLHTNTSDLYQQSYRSVFNGDEPFCTGSGSGHAVLARVAYLEMARAALERAMRTSGASGLELRDTLWSAPVPIVAGEPVEIALVAGDQDAIAFEIYSTLGDEDVVHCQGQAVLIEHAPARLDLAQLQAQMQRGTLEAGEVDAAVGARAPAQPVVQRVHRGDGQLLARLDLPAGARGDAEQYVLHPSLLDGARHAGLVLIGALAAAPFEPVALASLRLLAALPAQAFAWVRHAQPAADAAAITLDIDLCDAQGNVCVQLLGIEYLPSVVHAVTAPAEQAAALPATAPVQSVVPVRAMPTLMAVNTPARATGIGAPGFDVAAVERNKPRIVLVDPQVFAAQPRHGGPRHRPRITLPSLSSRQGGVSTAAGLSVYDHGNGVVSIRIVEGQDNTLSVGLIDALLHALEMVRARDATRVVVLTGTEGSFLRGPSAAYNAALEGQLYQAIAAFPYPLIAAMAGDATDAGWWVGALCDLMVCSDEGRYGYAQAELYALAGQSAWLTERFGEVHAQQLQSPTGYWTGAQLKAAGWTCPIVPRAQVEAQAQALADELASKPAEALRLLKGHLGRHLQLRAAALEPVEALPGGRWTSTPDARVIRLDQRDLQTVQQQLAEAIAQIEASGAYRCIVLVSELSPFEGAEAEPAVLALQQLIVDAPVPVIAALGGDARGIGWLVGASCDACIYSEAGWYSAADVCSSAALGARAALLFTAHLGQELGQEVLLTSEQYAGTQLRERVGALRVVPAAHVVATAHELARAWSAQDPGRVQLWKRTRATARQAQIAALPAWREHGADAPTLVAGRIALNSDVVTATAHADGVLVVELHDRQAKNMFSEALVAGVGDVFAHIERTAYKAVVLTGYDTYFASGGTKESLLAIQSGQAKFTDFKIFHLALQCAVPVIAAMQGHGIGAGWSLGMFADVAMFGDESHYVSPYMNYGFTPGAGSTLVFPQRLGQDLAREGLLSAREYLGRELRERGMDQRVLPREQVLAAARALAQRIARSPRDRLVNLKRQWTAVLRDAVEQTYALELAMHDRTFVGRSETTAHIHNHFAQVKRPAQRKAAATAPTPAPASVTAPTRWAAPATATAKGVDTLSTIRARLKDSLAAELHMQGRPIDNDVQFVHLGIDSINGVTWMRRINEEFGAAYEATTLYNYPTIRELGAFLHKELKSAPVSHTDVAEVHADTAPRQAPTVVRSVRPAPVTAKRVDTQSTIKARLKDSLAAELHMQGRPIDDDVQFVHLGIDSINGVTWMRRINEEFGTAYEATTMYNYPTIRELAAFLRKELESVPVSDAEAVEDAVDAAPLTAPAVLRSVRKDIRIARQAPRAQPESDHRIAIVGVSGRYPQAGNLSEYWNNLVQGRNCIVEVPKTRWDVCRFYDPDSKQKNKMVSKWLGAMDDVDCFDPLFFRISPDEAEYMDPQHRLFLQESYRAFEDAGYSVQSLSNRKCGVYLGISTNEYGLLLSQNGVMAAPVTGNSYAIAAARIAYYLNLKGPAISVDTACSSSLVSLHLACQALRSGEIDMALAGGVSLWLTPESYLAMSQAGMLSPHGQCKAFDDSADGIVMGDGVGVLVLKRLQDAEADQDLIYGVVIGSGTNQDGRTNGITAPSVNSQIELERSVYAKYGIDPATISYVETHGTGTKLGDPIEIEALATVFEERTNKKNYCALASVKSNIGHTASAAGVASVQKVLLSMQHRMLAPTLHVSKENSHFDFRNSPFYVNRIAQPWHVPEGSLRRACVNSFGYSGTNAHVVIEEYAAPTPARSLRPQRAGAGVAVPLSARSVDQLQHKARDLLAFLEQRRTDGDRSASADLRAIAYTLQVGREAMEERIGFLAKSVEQLADQLRSYLNGHHGIAGLHRGDADSQYGARASGSDEDMQETVTRCIARGELSELLDAWVCDVDVDWNSLYGDAKPARVSLPTYPFAKERYWIEAAAVDQPVGSAPCLAESLEWIENILTQVDSDRLDERQAVAFLRERV